MPNSITNNLQVMNNTLRATKTPTTIRVNGTATTAHDFLKENTVAPHQTTGDLTEMTRKLTTLAVAEI